MTALLITLGALFIVAEVLAQNDFKGLRIIYPHIYNGCKKIKSFFVKEN